MTPSVRAARKPSASPPALPGRLLDVDHPVLAEAVRAHAEAVREEGLSVLHLDLAVVGEAPEDALALGGVLEQQRDAEALRRAPALRWRIAPEERVVTELESLVHDPVLHLGRRLRRER